MSRERFKVRIVPQTSGTLQDLVPVGLREGDEDFLRELVDPEQKENLLLPAIGGMQKLAISHGLVLPPVDELLRRVNLISSTSMYYLERFVDGSEATEHYAGITLGRSFNNRACAINMGFWNQITPSNFALIASGVTTTAVRELWESLTYVEFWVNPKDQTELLRRHGICVNPPAVEFGDPEAQAVFSLDYIGMDLLKEGYYEYLTRESMESIGLDFYQIPTYKPYLEIADLLVQKLGTDIPLFQASFTKEGMLLLEKSLDRSFGKPQTYRVLALALGTDEYTVWKAEQEGWPNSGYKLTKELIANGI